MSSFKPKLYRSLDGCCICKAKSSSSRFTDSKKYEEDCVGCFKLEDARNGEICNACVLIVKRWKKLPANTTKDWHHVVDARTGPGIKNVFKNKKKDSSLGCPEKHVYKHKHVYRRKRKRATPMRSNLDNFHLKEQSYLLDFIDTDYWRRKSCSSGVVYIGQCGEVMLDRRYSRSENTSPSAHASELEISTEISTSLSSLDKDQENQDVENEEFYAETAKPSLDLDSSNVNNNETDNDDTFYNKLESKIDNFTANLITSH